MTGSKPEPTVGFTVANVRLTESTFERRFGDFPEGERQILRSIDSKIISDEATSFVVELRVSVYGTAGEIETWRAMCSYAARFGFSSESELGAAAARNVHAPALLYGFVREHIFDLTRRGGFSGPILPPMNFMANVTSDPNQMQEIHQEDQSQS